MGQLSFNPMSTLRAAVLFAVYFLFAIALLELGGEFHSGFDHHPDEPAHFVTGVMLRDFILERFPAAPLAFAGDFYVHYPEVAFGHWPPMFYVLQAAWMLLFPPSHTSMLFFMAALAAIAALLVCLAARKQVSPALAFLSGLTFLALPATQKYTAQIMIEMPIALFGLVAVLALIRSIDQPSWRAAAWFGAAASAAILTKSSGWAIGLATVFDLLAIRAWRNRAYLRLALSAGMVFALCLPFYLWTRRMASAGTESRSITVTRSVHDLWLLLASLPDSLGFVLIALALCGFVAKVVLPARRGNVENYWWAMTSYVASVFVFHAVAPTLAEPRKVFMALPALVLFGFAGIAWLIAKRERLGIALAVALPVLLIAPSVHASRSRCDPFAAAADRLLSDTAVDAPVTLISSSHPGGEGALIADVAAREPRPARILLRATKLLATSTWNGLDYKLRYDSPEAMLGALESIPVRRVVLNTAPGPAFPHHELLARALDERPADWQRIYSASTCGSEQLSIYSLRKQVVNASGKIQIDLRDKLNLILDYRLPH